MATPKTQAGITTRPYEDSPVDASASRTSTFSTTEDTSASLGPPYRTYRRRWVGLLQLTLLNIVVSWGWLTFAPVTTSSAKYFKTTETIINWLSTAFLFAFAFAAPATIYTLNRYGPRGSVWAASALILVGNWIRYAGAKSSNFGVVMFGQILIGLAQPFVLAAPTRYSDMWFSERGRIAATALPSLANPFGGAIGQLVDPAFVSSDPASIVNMVLYVAIISSVAALLSIAVPARPPTPPSATASSRRPDFSLGAIRSLFRNPSFHILLWPFTAYVTIFNAFSSEINNILFPYGFDETQAGITGALLILPGLGVTALLSPLLDRMNIRTLALKILVPVISTMYLAFIWAPGTRDVEAPYIIATIMGTASFVLLPLALELLVETTYPINPEISSTICWTLGQVLGGVGIIVMDALRIRGGGSGAEAGEPAGSMKRGLILLAVLAWVIVPLPMFVGWRGLGREKRREAEREALVSGRRSGSS